MKIKNVIAMVCFIFLTSCACTNGSCPGACGNGGGCGAATTSSGCPANNSPNCDCVDPSCFNSTGSCTHGCCNVFGNIGSHDGGLPSDEF